jgi:hypothetical protein
LQYGDPLVFCVTFEGDRLNKHAAAILALVTVIALAPAGGCSRLARGALRAGRGSNSYGSSREIKPEDIKISIADLDAKSVKLLNGYRAKWAVYVQKYNATDVEGAAQVLAVLEGFNNAHWSEKPRVEDFSEPLGVAIGDALKREGNINWVLAEGDTICLVNPTGKVAVAPVGIAASWLAGKKHPMEQLIKDVAKAVRETTGEPVLFGFEDAGEDAGEPQLR